MGRLGKSLHLQSRESEIYISAKKYSIHHFSIYINLSMGARNTKMERNRLADLIAHPKSNFWSLGLIQ